MKKTLSVIIAACIVLTSCATIFGGKVTPCQKMKPEPGQPRRQLRVAPLILDSFTTLFVGLIVDFGTNAIYKPCDRPKISKEQSEALQASYEKPVIADLPMNADQKQVNLVYLVNWGPVANKEFFLAYYDETKLKRIIASEITDANGIVSFIIPASKDSSSAPFYFSYEINDFAHNKFALRIPSAKETAKAGEKSVTLIVYDGYSFEFHDCIQLIGFPQNGAQTGNGGDVLTGGKFSLR
jgi:hypothetical protein